MQLKEAIEKRSSVRGYLDKKVSKETVKKILSLANRAVSANNTQPWEYYIVGGDKLKELAKYNIEDLNSNREFDYEEAPSSGIYKERSREIGKALFKAMGIERENKEKRRAWSQRGFRFFDAPVGIIICLDKSLNEKDSRFDIGSISQNIALAALEYGLGTCVQYQAVYYHRGLKEVLNIPENKIPVVGIALGYPDPNFPANQVRSTREEIDNISTWIGF